MKRARRARFQAGAWTVDPELNALRDGSTEHHVEPKVMDVLIVLAAQPGRVVTKEELLSAVWPDSFVSDDALTRCISLLRRVTQDDPHAPHFIQTIPKVGYRLVAHLAELPESEVHAFPEAAEGAVSPSQATQAAQPAASASAAPLLDDSRRPRAGRGLLIACAALLVVAALLGAGWLQNPRRESEISFRTVQFTSAAGEQVQPAFSPDGRTMAYVRIGEDSQSRRIYLRKVDGGASRELAAGTDAQFSPAWSPDNQRIAYLSRGVDGTLGIFVAPATGLSPPRKLYTPEIVTHWEQGALSWSPDGKSLIFPDHRNAAPGSSILRLDLATGKTQAMTTPPSGWEGDLTPAWSPDGQSFAFTRASETAVRDIFRFNLKDKRVLQLTHEGSQMDGLAWGRNGEAIVFSSNRGGKYALWRIGLRGGEPERLPFGTEDAFQPAVGPLKGQYAYAQGSAIWNIDRLDEGAGGRTVLSSTQQDSAPALAPDGQSFAFQSHRSGNQELWLAHVDGSGLRQLTSIGGAATGSPAWSYDGRQILFDARPGAHSHIFALTLSGGVPRQLTFGENNDIVPRWSRDGRSVYFRSNRGGRWRLWRVSADGQKPQPITGEDGIAAEESADGRWLYYARGDAPGLWRMPVGGGAEADVLPVLAAGFWGYFDVAPEGVYFLDRSRPPGAIALWNPTTGRTHAVATLLGTAPQLQGLSVGPQGKPLLIGEERDAGLHITLVTQK